MKFITLTDCRIDLPVLINPMMITAIVVLDPTGKSSGSKVHTLNNDVWSVMETAEEIQKLIKKSENTTTITWETGPR
jgi:hypothetical protein